MKTIFFLALAVLGMAMTSCTQTKQVRAKDNDGTVVTVTLERHSPLKAGDTVFVLYNSQYWLICHNCINDKYGVRKVVLQGDK